MRNERHRINPNDLPDPSLFSSKTALLECYVYANLNINIFVHARIKSVRLFCVIDEVVELRPNQLIDWREK